MNPSSLDWSIQSALSSLFPPFEATAPTVLSQLFRTIEERYHGDALQCLLNFLIPAKHILESVQQAACAAYSDVLFQCEGWPLCLSDRVVIQLAAINPLLLRPGDFYLQVEPFGEQSARIVLKSLLVQEDLLGQENLILQAGSRVLECPTIEETPILETSYPCIFTESWLREINEGRQGNRLSRCVLSSDKGVVKVPWTEVANPEFLDRPKSNVWPDSKPCSTATIRVRDLNTEISDIESKVVVDFLPLEMETRIVPAIDGLALSVQLVESGSRLVKVNQAHTISSFAGKPVGWVSPNTWDSRQTQELEGEYVDLLEFNKEKETLVPNKIAMPMKPLGFKLVRTAQPSSKSNVSICGVDCNPNKQPSEIMQHDPDSKCRYRQSYMAALRNPVNFERASMLPCLDETRTDAGKAEPSCEGYGVGLRLQPSSCMFGQTPNQADRNPMQSFENSAQQKQSPKNSTQPSQNVPHDRKSRENADSPDQHMTQLITSMVQARQHHKSFLTGQPDLPQTVLGTKALPDKRHPCLNNAIRQDSFHMRISGQKHAKTQHLPKMGLRALPDHGGHRHDANLCLQGFSPIQHSQNQPTHITEQTPQPQISQNPFRNENSLLDCNVFCDDRHCGRGPGSPVQVIKGKSRSKSRSSLSVSETARQCLQSNKPTNRSHSDVYPEIIPMLPAIHGIKHTADLVSPKLNRPQEARKEVSLSGKAGAPVVNGVELQKLQHSDQPTTGQSVTEIQGIYISQDPTIKSLLQLGIICLPGGRDRAGRAVVEVYGGRNGWISPQVSPLELCRLLLYLHSIPRSEVRELGLTVVIDSRKCPLTSVFYKSLLMVQEQALHAVHTILMLVDKDANPRPEKHPGLQIDVVTSLKALHKTVDGHQLTSDLSGSFPYSHEDWLQFHQKLSLFQIELEAASSLLHTAIRRLDVKRTDTAKDVQSCIQEQRSSMKMVLEDTRLVALQREGGAILARMRREESRFAHSEDFRDSLESVTCLYDQVEESVHTLVMKSNQSLQHLEHVLLLRETQDSLHTIQKWCDAEERLWQKDKDDAEKTLQKIQQRLQDTQTLLRQAKENKERGMLLIKDVERKSKGTHYPETDAFRCYTTGFKTRMTGFLLKAEERKSDLQTSVDLYRFCEEASSLVKECMEYLDHMKSSNSPMSVCWSSLHAFEQRFQHFSPQHFQDRSAALLERLPDGIWMWNAVQTQCRDIRQRLSEILQAAHTHKDSQDEAQLNPVSGQTQNRAAEQGDNETLTYLQSAEGSKFEQVMTSSVHEQSASRIQQSVECTEQETRHLHETKDKLHNASSMHNESTSHAQQSVQCTVQKASMLQETNNTSRNPSMHKDSASHIQESVQCTDQNTSHLHEPQAISHHPSDRKLKEHHHKHSHSDDDLRKSGRIHKFGQTAHYKVFIRSQSAESCLRGYRYNIPLCKTDAAASCVGASLEGLSSELNQHDSFCSSASGFSQKCSSDCGSEDHGSGVRCSDNAFTKQEESVCKPECILENTSTALKLQRIMQELLQTEQEYVRALAYVVENYMPELERPDVPQDLRGQRGLIFGNLEKLRDFHQHHFIQELELCLEKPFSVGRCFLKHKESFGLYALYSKNKPRSENLLIQHGKDFFKQKQQLLKDALDLSSYLLKPVQRISKYSLLLQDLLRECECVTNAELQRTEIHTALNIIQFQLRHGNNLLAMDDIYGCDVNLKEQGQLIRQDEFLLTFRKKKCYRHIFLFQDLILFSKTRKTDVGNDTYIYKQSFKTSDIGMTHNSGDSGLCFEIWFRRRKTQDTYVLQAASREVKESWTRDLERILWEQAIHNREIRMQERVFMGIGHKPFMDIKPSEMAISDRAINCVLTGRGGVSVLRLNSIGSASGTSSSGSQSSCSSGWGSPSTSAVCPVGGDDVRYIQETSGILEEDDLDQESGNHSTLVASSESSGESVSCFSTSAHSCSSVIGGDCEHTPSELGKQHKQDHLKTTNQTRDQSGSKVQSSIGKSTEV
ncbi:quattro isoform X1 [Danio rerio]|uniref:Quattro isoform X1 n=2 Tax=Danio rerio TaxID=7955 RepID=A0AB32TQS0_DANRE